MRLFDCDHWSMAVISDNRINTMPPPRIIFIFRNGICESVIWFDCFIDGQFSRSLTSYNNSIAFRLQWAQICENTFSIYKTVTVTSVLPVNSRNWCPPRNREQFSIIKLLLLSIVRHCLQLDNIFLYLMGMYNVITKLTTQTPLPNDLQIMIWLIIQYIL